MTPDFVDAAIALLAARGFTGRRTLRHMRRGRASLDWRAIYGEGSYGVG